MYHFKIKMHSIFEGSTSWSGNYFFKKTERKFCAVLIAVSYELVINTS